MNEERKELDLCGMLAIIALIIGTCVVASAFVKNAAHARDVRAYDSEMRELYRPAFNRARRIP